MTQRARDVLCRTIYRVAVDHGATLAQVAELSRAGEWIVKDPRSSYQKARTWKHGTFYAWLQLKTLLDTGLVTDPWAKSQTKEEPSHAAQTIS